MEETIVEINETIFRYFFDEEHEILYCISNRSNLFGFNHTIFQIAVDFVILRSYSQMTICCMVCERIEGTKTPFEIILKTIRFVKT